MIYFSSQVFGRAKFGILQKVAFCAAICGKTQGKRASFVSRNVAYCHAVCMELKHRALQISQKSVAKKDNKGEKRT